jgi:hypothetical protein
MRSQLFKGAGVTDDRLNGVRDWRPDRTCDGESLLLVERLLRRPDRLGGFEAIVDALEDQLSSVDVASTVLFRERRFETLRRPPA